MAVRVRFLLLLILLASAVMLPWLGRTRFWDQDEGFFASTAAEMYARGDWIVPTFNGRMFGHKPPWMYWMMMLGFETFGVNEFAARLGSAIFGIATVLLTYDFGRRLFSDRAGWWAGLALASCWMFNIVARAATPDVYLVFFVTLSLYLFARWGFLSQLPEQQAEGIEPSQIRGQNSALPSRWSQFALIYAVMGLAVLVKGPLGVLFPMAVIGMFLLCMTRRRDLPSDANRWRRWREAWRPFGIVNFCGTVWRMRPLTAAALVLFVAGPWYAAVGWKTNGEFLNEFFGVHHFRRFTTPMDNHRGPIFYYLPAVLAGMFPWSIFAVPGMLYVIRGLRSSKQRPQLTFLLCWAGVFIGLFSLASTKLPNYVLPAYPALALLCGAMVDGWLADRRQVSLPWIRVGLTVMIAVGLAIMIGLPLAANWRFDGQTLLDRVRIVRAVQDDAGWLGVLGVPLVLGGFAAFACAWRNAARPAVVAMGTSAIATLWLLWGYAAPRVDRFQSPQDMAQVVGEQAGESSMRVGHFGCFKPSMVFYSGRPIEACGDAEEVGQLFREAETSFLFTTDERYEELRRALPPDVVVVERRPNFPKTGELLLLGRSPRIAGRQELHR
ncbi:MAG: glycosyltransferase family 39 protein [Planctomycetales bacterium]|nr:glycosyltransferase family 39 protein [Planctomycetales bacterium]